MLSVYMPPQHYRDFSAMHSYTFQKSTRKLKVVLKEKLKGATCSKPVKSRVPSIGVQ